LLGEGLLLRIATGGRVLLAGGDKASFGVVRLMAGCTLAGCSLGTGTWLVALVNPVSECGSPGLL